MFALRVSSILVGLVLIAGPLKAVEQGWELQRDRDGIQVYTQKRAGSTHDAVRSQMTIKANLNSVIGLVRDTTACPEWAELCKEAYEHEVVSEKELYVYTYNNIPWPVKDRDALTHVIWDQDAETGEVTMTATATTDILPVNKKAVRIIDAHVQWTFLPLADGSLEVTSVAHIDPNGPTPSWITNLLLVDTPFKTLEGMRRVLASGRYDDTKIDFLKVD